MNVEEPEAAASEVAPPETPVVAPPATQSSPTTDSEAHDSDEEQEEEDCCKFCYDVEDSQHTLVTPCACRGTSSCVHLECLKSWHEYEGFPEEPRCGLCGEHYSGDVAIELARMNLSNAVGRQGWRSATAAVALAQLGDLHKGRGEDDDAEQLYRQSLEIDSQLGPSAHARVASDLSRLASLYADQGLEGRAKPLYRRAFDIRAATLGPTHPAALDTLATIAALASGHGREAAAQSLPLHGYVLHVMEKVHGPMAAPLAPALLAAAKSHAAAANVDAALPLAIRALAINTVAMGEHHADTLRMGITVGELQRTLGALDEAAATLERTVTGAAAALGEDHPTVAAALCAMGNVRLQQGQPSEALQLCARARCATDSLQAKTTAAAGETLAATAVALRAQGALLLRCGVREAAVAAYEKALATAEATHGPTHPAVAGVAIQLAYALLDVSCKQRDAEDMVASLATETVESSSPTFTVTDPSIAAADRSGDSAADTATSMTAARAVALAHRSVAITMNQLGSRVHPKVGEALDDLAAVLTAAGQDEEAAAVVARKVAAAAEWAESPLAHTADCCQSGRRIGGGRTGRHAAALACFHMRQMSSSSMLDMLCSDQLLPKIDSTASPGRLCIREAPACLFLEHEGQRHHGLGLRASRAARGVHGDHDDGSRARAGRRHAGGAMATAIAASRDRQVREASTRAGGGGGGSRGGGFFKWFGMCMGAENVSNSNEGTSRVSR